MGLLRPRLGDRPDDHIEDSPVSAAGQSQIYRDSVNWVTRRARPGSCGATVRLSGGIGVQPHHACRARLVEVDEVTAGAQEVAERFEAQSFFAE